MAKVKSLTNQREIVPPEKKTYQGNSKRTKFSATSANPNPKKKYRGQGK
jgi:hypothetical protein